MRHRKPRSAAASRPASQSDVLPIPASPGDQRRGKLARGRRGNRRSRGAPLPCRRDHGRGWHVHVSCAAVAQEFKLPDLGEGLTEAEIARWLVAEGQAIDEDQPLVEVQTDKTTVEIPSPRGGNRR